MQAGREPVKRQPACGESVTHVVHVHAGGTGKVKAPTPGRAASAAQRAANTGGSNLLNEDAGTTVGKHLPRQRCMTCQKR